MPFSPTDAHNEIIKATPGACTEINKFSRKVFRTRGGRIGSGMGTLLEALWGNYVNTQLHKSARCEIAWLSDHEYNDYACVEINAEWSAETRRGELLRIEAKSMNADADESKGHFDELIRNLGAHDILLVLIWRWKQVDHLRVFPHIDGHFAGSARRIAELRDALHLARGGTFVNNNHCPDGCPPSKCSHSGEPLNAAGHRERRQGPDSCKAANVSHLANFGGLRRMLYTRSPEARQVLQEYRRKCDIANGYISLIHRHFPQQEESQYSFAYWRKTAEQLGIETTGKTKRELVADIRNASEYMDILRNL